MHAAMLAALLCAATAPPPAQAAVNGAVPRVQVIPSRPKRKSNKPPVTGVLNVNRASEAELRLLPGIGKKRAEAIVERRAKKPFATVEEVGRIKGMRALVQRLRSHLVVQGDSTVRPLRP